MKRNGLVLFVFLALLIGQNSWSQNPSPREGKPSQPQQRQSQSSQQPSATYQRGTEGSPVIVKVLPTPKTKEEATTEAKEREEKAANEYNVAKFTGWIAYIGIAQIIVFFLQLIVFGYQARMLRQTVNVMNDTEIRQLRAYISVVPMITKPETGKTPVANVIIKNYGQTPAYKFTQVVGIGLGISFDTLRPPDNYPRLSKATLTPTDTLGIQTSGAWAFSDKEISELNSGTKTIWVHGEINYEDTFGIKRFKKYRYFIGGGAGMRLDMMFVCEEGNEEN